MNTKLIIIFAILAGSLAVATRKRRQTIVDSGPTGLGAPSQPNNPGNSGASGSQEMTPSGGSSGSDGESEGILATLGGIIGGALSLPGAIITTVFSTIGSVFSGISSLF